MVKIELGEPIFPVLLDVMFIAVFIFLTIIFSVGANKNRQSVKQIKKAIKSGSKIPKLPDEE
jgi:hypothetical protein